MAEFYLAPSLEITALWSALFKNFSPDQPPEGVYFKRCFFNLMRGDKFINNELKIQKISINDIKMYENNPRSNDEAVKYVANSIKKFGFKVPVIIDKNHTIIAGHTRFKAAKKLNIENLPCLIADDLDDKQIKAFRLADNKVSEFSDWNFDHVLK